jgi:peroxiredoxin
MSPRKTLLLAAGLITMVIVSGWFTERIAHLNAGADDQGTGALTGAAAPDFSLKDVAGNTVKLSDFRHKKTVVVAFWASWCVPCRLELPWLASFYQDNRAHNVEVLAVSIDQNPADARHFAAENKLPFPVLLDSQEQVASRYQVNEIPTILVIDRAGTLQARHSGVSPSLEAGLAAEVRQDSGGARIHNGD